MEHILKSSSPTVRHFNTVIETGTTSINFEWLISPVVSEPTTLLLTGTILESRNNPPITPQSRMDLKTKVSGDTIPFSMIELVELFQRAPMGIHCTRDGRVLWANQSQLQLLGYSAIEYIGRDVLEFIKNPQLYQTVIDQVQSGIVVRDFKTQMITKDGHVKHMIVDSSPYFNLDGTFSHTATFLRDDLERIMTDLIIQEQLERYQTITREKDRFIRIMFHEIRTPLHVLSQSTTTLINAMESDQMSLLEAATMTTQVDRCLGLVEDLSFAMMCEADKVISPRPEACNFRARVANKVKQLGIQTSADGSLTQQTHKDFSFQQQIQDTLPQWVMSDRSLYRVLYNLMTNAVKFCALKGQGVASLGYKSTSPFVATPVSDSHSDTGMLTFSITNTVSAPLDLICINKIFQKYLHAHSETATQTSSSDILHNAMLGSSSSTRLSSPRLPVAISSDGVLKRSESSPSANHFTSTLTSSDGLGLGLFVSYNIVQSLGGMLECSTTDTEACFSFAIPVSEAAAPVTSPLTHNPNTEKKVKKPRSNGNAESWLSVSKSAAGSKHVVNLRTKVNGGGSFSASPEASPIGSSSKRKVGSNRIQRILVVDDSPICRKVLIKSLEENGFATDFACDGQEACDKLSAIPCTFDAVLMDLRMPIMDGLTATRICKERHHLKNLPFIVVTAELGEDIRQAAMDAGASNFVSKPARIGELLSILKEQIIEK